MPHPVRTGLGCARFPSDPRRPRPVLRAGEVPVMRTEPARQLARPLDGHPLEERLLPPNDLQNRTSFEKSSTINTSSLTLMAKPLIPGTFGLH
jgi:hypothetical protein